MIKTKQLSNGLTVVFEEMTHLRSVSLGCWVNVGSANENPRNNGIAHVIEHMMFKGTKNRTANQLADDCTMIGGNMNAYTSKECTSYYVTTLDTHLENAIDIMSDMLCNSLFKEEDLEKEKGVIIDEIDMYDDSPDDLVHELLQQEVWKDHPLGYIISGPKENVELMTRQDLLEFMDLYYVADNMVISVAGNFEEESLLALLEKYFAEIKPTSNRLPITVPEYSKVFVVRNKDIEQVHMNIAFDAVTTMSEEKYAMSIANAVFGGNESSVLFQKIREDLGLAYSIYSYPSPYNIAGLFQIDATLNTNNVMTVLKTMMECMTEFKKVGITESVLNRAKEQIICELLLGSESSRDRMNNNGKSMLCQGKVEDLSETVEKVRAVTCEDVHQFVEKYFRTDCFSICFVGNTDCIELDKIKAYWEEMTRA
ncbi:MAG: pitrilysin family protein [bacterium]|nr:pitrilysin family protein [bacterium]